MSKNTKKTANPKRAATVAKKVPQQKPRAKGTAPVEGVVYAPVIADPGETNATPDAPETPKAKKIASKKADGKMSGLDAAAKVLAEAGEALNAKEIVDRMLATGLWATGGKTPHATIYAAMLRSIVKQGNASRFRKAARGKFTVAS